MTVTGNRIVVRHGDRSRPASGFSLRNTGGGVLIKGNYIWARTAGVSIDSRARGSRVEDNTFVRSNDTWQLKTGEGAANCVFKDNRVVAPPGGGVAPAAPKGLAVTPRINGCELHWKANAEDDVLGYYVYRDGKRVEERLKCGRFYVDTAVKAGEKHSYAVSAVSLSGKESARSKAVEVALDRPASGSAGTPGTTSRP